MSSNNILFLMCNTKYVTICLCPGTSPSSHARVKKCHNDTWDAHKKQSLQLSPKKPFSSHISHDSHIFLPTSSSTDDGRVHLLKSSAVHPTDCLWGWDLESVVDNPRVKMMSNASWTTVSQFEPEESWHWHLGTCLCHQGTKNPLMEKPGRSTYLGS